MRLADKRLIDVLDVLMKEDIVVRGMVLRVTKSGEVQLVACEYEKKPEEIPQQR